MPSCSRSRTKTRGRAHGRAKDVDPRHPVDAGNLRELARRLVDRVHVFALATLDEEAPKNRKDDGLFVVRFRYA